MYQTYQGRHYLEYKEMHKINTKIPKTQTLELPIKQQANEPTEWTVLKRSHKMDNKYFSVWHLYDQRNINNYFQLGVVRHTFNPLRPRLKKTNQTKNPPTIKKVNFEIQSHPRQNGMENE